MDANSLVELCVVEGAIKFKEGTPLFIRPNFSVPESKWQNREEEVLIITPAGREIVAPTRLNTSHILIRDPEAPLDSRWRTTLSFVGLSQEDVPIGSRILAAPELVKALRG